MIELLYFSTLLDEYMAALGPSEAPVDTYKGTLWDRQDGGESSFASSECSSDSGLDPPCTMSILERLIRSRPIWFLQDLTRTGATHLLQGQQPGAFIVRGSTKADCFGLSVRLPSGKGPYIEHYLIEMRDKKLALETSCNLFDNIQMLIAHYTNCCDELPVQLKLPKEVSNAQSRQDLISLSHLGQEFWGRSKISNSSPTTNTPTSNNANVSSQSSLSSMSSFKSDNTNWQQNPLQQDIDNHNQKINKPTSLPVSQSPVDMPPVILNLKPLNGTKEPLSLSTFRTSPIGAASPSPSTPASTVALTFFTSPTTVTSPVSPSSGSAFHVVPSSLQPAHLKSLASANNSLVSLKNKANTPPPPPPRWSKSVSSPSQNFTFTTTVTLNLTPTSSASPIEVTVNRQSPDKCEANIKVNQLEFLNNTSSIARPTSLNLSPDSDNPSNSIESNKQRLRKRRKSGSNKKSYHYKECIIESPSTCYRSALADKVSDYEDIWANSPPESAISPGFTTFKTPSPESKTTTTPIMAKDLQSFTQAIKEMTRDNLNSRDSDSKKQPGPFYADPVDALSKKGKMRRAEIVEDIKKYSRLRNHRHSDPSIQLPQLLVDHPPLATINSSEEVHNLSSSMDNLASLKKTSPKFENLNKSNRSRSTDLVDLTKQRCGSIRGKQGGLVVGKPVKPPTVNKPKKNCSWQVDEGWQYVAQEGEPGNVNNRRSFKQQHQQSETKFPVITNKSNSVITYSNTIEDMIIDKFPEMKLPDPRYSVQCSALRISDFSDYDNLLDKKVDSENPYHPSTVSEAPTEFSEPWDSTKWEPIIKMMKESGVTERSPDIVKSTAEDSESVIHTSGVGIIEDETSVDDTPIRRDIKRSKSFQERMEPFLGPPRLQTLKKTRVDYDTGGNIKNYVIHLADDKGTTFAQNIEKFIQCTQESSETNPYVTLRNVRQFMSGIKNYLVKHGEGDFINIVSRERNKLKATEFLNLDAILEGCLHQLVLPSLRPHIYQLFLSHLQPQIKQLAGCIQLARSLSPQQLGLKPELGSVTGPCLSLMRHHLEKMEHVTSPLHKLESLLAAIAQLFNTLSSGRRGKKSPLSAEEFLPALVYSLAQVGLLGLEIEGEYTWGLLHPSLHAGEGGYYLAMLSGALHALKNITPDNSPTQLASLCSAAGFLRVSIPDEDHGTLVTHTLPVRPGMTCRELTKMLAHRLRLSSTQDFALYKVIHGEETLLGDGESPQVIQTTLTNKGIPVRFMYKRIDANLALPLENQRFI